MSDAITTVKTHIVNKDARKEFAALGAWEAAGIALVEYLESIANTPTGKLEICEALGWDFRQFKAAVSFANTYLEAEHAHILCLYSSTTVINGRARRIHTYEIADTDQKLRQQLLKKNKQTSGKLHAEVVIGRIIMRHPNQALNGMRRELADIIKANVEHEAIAEEFASIISGGDTEAEEQATRSARAPTPNELGATPPKQRTAAPESKKSRMDAIRERAHRKAESEFEKYGPSTTSSAPPAHGSTTTSKPPDAFALFVEAFATLTDEEKRELLRRIAGHQSATTTP